MVEQVKEVQAWWRELPRVERLIRAVLGLLVLLYGGVLGFDRIYKGPVRLDAAELRLDEHEAAIRDLQMQSPRTTYLFCVDLADRGLITKTAQDCYQDYSLTSARP